MDINAIIISYCVKPLHSHRALCPVE